MFMFLLLHSRLLKGSGKTDADWSLSFREVNGGRVNMIYFSRTSSKAKLNFLGALSCVAPEGGNRARALGSVLSWRVPDGPFGLRSTGSVNSRKMGLALGPNGG
ncbi:hypothetical protein AAFF_G00325950 [Aldrovandia affinis]|uniref:Secreted protein n=1 Tax=Aldrovandia affinis TaxID=143900 RepID=A0AAD7T9B6_9TELE|nr:hypothetical protein AAFF_G00325950 [Aldrovandia affinis]